jgi:hypothetical protein
MTNEGDIDRKKALSLLMWRKAAECRAKAKTADHKALEGYWNRQRDRCAAAAVITFPGLYERFAKNQYVGLVTVRVRSTVIRKQLPPKEREMHVVARLIENVELKAVKAMNVADANGWEPNGGTES